MTAMTKRVTGKVAPLFETLNNDLIWFLNC